MTVQMTLGVQSFCVGDGHFSAVEHNPTVGKWLDATWQGCLVLDSGGDVVFHHADIQNVIQRTADGGEDVGDWQQLNLFAGSTMPQFSRSFIKVRSS